MLQGVYTAASSLDTLERWQGAISQNLAASNGTGYRKVAFAIEGMDAGKLDGKGTGPLADNKGSMPKIVTSTSFAEGEIQETGKRTDVAVQGPGFFQVKGPDGKPGFTRDGEFHFNANGQLVTKRGWEVQGEGGAITFDPKKGQPTISPEGIISQDDTIIGKLPLYDFKDTSVLQRRDGGVFSAGEDAIPTPVAKPQMLQGFTEKGNANPLGDMVNLITVARAYEASQKVITSQDELLQSAIRSLGNPNA